MPSKIDNFVWLRYKMARRLGAKNSEDFNKLILSKNRLTQTLVCIYYHTEYRLSSKGGYDFFMIYTYNFIKRTKKEIAQTPMIKSRVEIEVDEKWYDILRRLDYKIDYNNDKQKSVNLTKMKMTIEDFADPEAHDFDEFIEKRKMEEQDLAEIQAYSKKMWAVRDELFDKLSYKQYLAYFLSKYVEVPNTHIAEIMQNTGLQHKNRSILTYSTKPISKH